MIESTVIKDVQEYLQKWESVNNPFYPNEMRWDRLRVNEFLSDYKKQFERSDNSDYAVTPTASRKLPSLEDVMEDCYDGCMDEDTVKEVYETIKKLGNFA